MALSSATITYNLNDQLGVDVVPNSATISVRTNIPGQTIVDTAGNEVRLGPAGFKLATGGTGSFTVWVPGTGSNPASWQTYVDVTYKAWSTTPAGKYSRVDRTRTFGPFTITGNADLADLIEEQEVPPEYAGQIVTEMQGLRDESQDLRDQQVALSGIDDSDSATAYNAQYGPLTTVALSASIDTRRETYGQFIPELFGAVGNGVADDTTAVQACIDAAQAAISGGSAGGYGKVPTVEFYGRYRITSSLDWKSAHLRAPYPLDGAALEWDGPAGGTVIRKWGSAHTGGASYALFDGLALLPGGSEPGTWIDFTTAPAAQALVDKFGIIRNAQFGDCSSDAIRVGSWVNAHWKNIRFDSVGGYCVKLTPGPEVNLASFELDTFTYDHRRATTPGKGVIGVDTTALTSGNLGVIRLSNGRVEYNLHNLDAKAGLFVHRSAAASGPRVGFHAEDLTIATGGGVTPVPVLYRDVVSTTDQPDLLLVNVVTDNPVLGGTKPGNTPDLPAGSYALLDLSSGPVASTEVDVRAYATGAAALRVRQGADTAPRWDITSDGQMEFGSGSASPDARIWRLGNGIVGMLTGYWRNQRCTTSTRPTGLTFNDRGIQVYDETIEKTITWTGGQWRDGAGTPV